MSEEAEEKTTKAEKPRDPAVPVREVEFRGDSALVEWIDGDGKYRRAYIPVSQLRDGMVTARALDKGIPYGIVWENHIKVLATPEAIANDLRRRGIWVWGDLNNSVLQLVNRAFDQGAFLRSVEQEERT